ncbi:hypothetical protein AAMO2058_000938700 [Amorphochlora amoebiformis]
MESKKKAGPSAEDDMPKQVATFENQRYYPIRSWSSTLLPTDRPTWSLENGTPAPKSAFELPQSRVWEWVDEWQVEIRKDTDANGWQYAVDFGLWAWTNIPSSKTFVRRRKFIRTLRLVDGDSDAAVLEPQTRQEGQSAGASIGESTKEGKATTVDVEGEMIRDVYTWENERNYFASWSSRLLPTDRFQWSSKDGSTRGDRSSFTLPSKKWEWDGYWRVKAGEDTDSQGWEYAVDFGWSWGRIQTGKTFTRRRKWVRTMKLKDAKQATQTQKTTVTLRFASGKLGLRFHEHNVVTAVIKGSQAEKKGVRKGWVITRINGKRAPDQDPAYLQIILKNFFSLDGDVDIEFNTRGHRALSKEEHELVLEYFKLLDVDGNGWIDIKEAKATLHRDWKLLFESSSDLISEGKCSRDKFIDIFVRYKNLDVQYSQQPVEHENNQDEEVLHSPDFHTDPKPEEGKQVAPAPAPAEAKSSTQASSTEQDAKPVVVEEQDLSARLRKCILQVRSDVQKSRMKLEEKMSDKVELKSESDDTDKKDQGEEEESKYWPLKKPIKEKTSYLLTKTVV